MKHVGQNIKSLRLKYGWNQKIVARQLKISIPAFSKIETSTTDINLTRLDELATLFDVSVFDLLKKPGEESIWPLERELKDCKNILEVQEKEISSLRKKVIELFDELRGK